jgi:hypothetical protein
MKIFVLCLLLFVVTLSGCDLLNPPADNTATDSQRPVLTLLSPSGDIYFNGADFLITGIASDDIAVASVKISVNGLAFSNAGGTEVWGKTVNLKQGVYEQNTVKIFSVDTSGKCSVTNSVKVYVKNKILAPDGTASDYFGTVGISGDGKRFAVGAAYDDDNGAGSGSLYVIDWNGAGWDSQKITASDGYAGQSFGWSVDISGDGSTVVSSSIYDNTKGPNAGAVYVYTWNGSTWEEKKLTASDGNADDRMGYQTAVSKYGNKVIAGAVNDADLGTHSGSAYFYMKTNNGVWIEKKLTASDASNGDGFGNSVAISDNGTTVVIGASGESAYKGAVYVYTGNGVTFSETKLVASDGLVGSLGTRVAVSGDGKTIAAGAPNCGGYGAVYIFRFNGFAWDESKISATPLDTQKFGNWVDISGDGNTVIAGDPWYYNNFITQCGAAFRFDWNGSSWVQKTYYHPNPAAYDYFGSIVSLSGDGNTFATGLSGDDDKGDSAGAVWVYSVNE